MGNQGHSKEGVRQFCELIWSGAIGQVREVHIWTNRPGRFWKQGDWTEPLPAERIPDHLDWDLWLGTAPVRPYNHIYAPHDWRGWWDFGCGALGDMGCHIMDPCNWALKLGPPTSVEPVLQTKKNDQTGPGKSIIRYEFPQRGDFAPVTVYWYDGGAMPPRPEGVPADEILGALRPDRPRSNGKNGSYYIGDKGIATVGEYGEAPRLLPESVHKDFTPPPRSIPRVIDNDPYKDWLQACKGGKPACSNFDYAGPFTETVLLGNVALRAGQKIMWDAKRMKITNVREANRYIRRKYRKGWHI